LHPGPPPRRNDGAEEGTREEAGSMTAGRLKVIRRRAASYKAVTCRFPPLRHFPGTEEGQGGGPYADKACAPSFEIVLNRAHCSRSGSAVGPRNTSDRFHPGGCGGPSKRGKRCSSADSAISASARASDAPRQKWVPWLKARWSFCCRPMSSWS